MIDFPAPNLAVRQAYYAHKSDAKRRGIPFNFTFDEWWDVWLTSGKWEQRGAHRGQFVMARPGDRGAYERGNVIICLAEDNRAERNRNYKLKGARHPHYGKNPWLTFGDPESAKEKKRKAMIPIAALRKRDERGHFCRGGGS